MHGINADHGAIARRQGLIGGVLSGILGGVPSATSTPPANGASDPLGLGTIISGITSALLPPQQTSSSSNLVSTNSTLSTSALLTSTATNLSSTTLSSTSSTQAPVTSTTPTSSLAVVTSTAADGGVVTATTYVTAASPSSTTPTVAPNSFLQNKGLEAGVFTVVGIIVLVLVTMIATVWIRTSGRRKLDREALDASAFDPSTMYRDEERASTEKLRRTGSISSRDSGHTHTTAGQAGLGGGFGQGGGYPAPPMPMPAYGQYRDQTTEMFEKPYPAFNVSRHIDPIYDPSRSPPSPGIPQVNVLPTSSYHDSRSNTTIPFSINVNNPHPGSLLNTPPTSPSLDSDNAGKQPRRLSDMPAAAPLPTKFGEEDDAEDAYSGMTYEETVQVPRTLRVANQ